MAPTPKNQPRSVILEGSSAGQDNLVINPKTTVWILQANFLYLKSMFFSLDGKEPKDQGCSKKSGNYTARCTEILKLARLAAGSDSKNLRALRVMS
ncbi:MAG: hypothetical protein AB7W47_15660 [Calditrichaceae bacterium]